MQAIDYSRCMARVEDLLREREFDLALQLTRKIEQTLATRQADENAAYRLPAAIYERLQSVRWAAEVGQRLSQLARTNGAGGDHLS